MENTWLAVSRIQLRLIGLFVAAADSGELVSWLNTATWWLLGEIKEGLHWRSTLEIAININWRALPPAGSLNNFVHHCDSYLSESLGVFCSSCSCFRKRNDQLWVVIVLPLRIILMEVNHLMFRKQHARMQCQPSSKQINQTDNTC